MVFARGKRSWVFRLVFAGFVCIQGSTALSLGQTADLRGQGGRTKLVQCHFMRSSLRRPGSSHGPVQSVKWTNARIKGNCPGCAPYMSTGGALGAGNPSPLHALVPVGGVVTKAALMFHHILWSGVVRVVSSLTPSAFEIKLSFRLLVAAAVGMAIGLERRTSQKTAGVRTMCLVAIGAASFTVVSENGFAKADQARVAASVATGVGFIGAGVITQSNKVADARSGKADDITADVRGLTTASAIWITAALGMACGTGLFFTAIFGTALTVLVLRVSRVQNSLLKEVNNLLVRLRLQEKVTEPERKDGSVGTRGGEGQGQSQEQEQGVEGADPVDGESTLAGISSKGALGKERKDSGASADHSDEEDGLYSGDSSQGEIPRKEDVHGKTDVELGVGEGEKSTIDPHRTAGRKIKKTRSRAPVIPQASFDAKSVVPDLLALQRYNAMLEEALALRSPYLGIGSAGLGRLGPSVSRWTPRSASPRAQDIRAWKFNSGRNYHPQYATAEDEKQEEKQEEEEEEEIEDGVEVGGERKQDQQWGGKKAKRVVARDQGVHQEEEGEKQREESARQDWREPGRRWGEVIGHPAPQGKEVELVGGGQALLRAGTNRTDGEMKRVPVISPTGLVEEEAWATGYDSYWEGRVADRKGYL